MEGWKYWIGKKVYIILKSKRVYQGEVLEVDDSSNPVVFITITDKLNKRVTFVASEIDVIQEEG